MSSSIVSAITMTTLTALKSMLDLSPDAVVIIDRVGAIVLLNRQANMLFGYASDQLVGCPLEVLLPERLRTDHLAHRGQYLAAPHSRPMGVGLDLVGRRQDGSEFPVDISLRPYLIKRQLHVMAAIRDVSAQRQWERERKDLLERLRLQTDLINLAHDAILVRDPADRILVWNTGAEELYGWRATEAIGQVTHSLFKTRFPMPRAAIQAQLNSEGAWEGELAHTRPDGRMVIVESRWVLVRDETGQPSAILEINRNITERRRLEEAEAAAQANTLVQLSFLQQLLDALPNGVYVVHGHDARLVLANRAATSAWGAVWRHEQPMVEFFDQHRILLTDAQGREIPMEQWATMRALYHSETTLQLQETIHRSQGNALPILVNAVPLAFSYWHSLEMRDVHGEGDTSTTGGGSPAEAKNTGEPLALVIQQDVRMLKEAEYIKDEFIGLAAHELRTPVAALKGAIGTLLLHTKEGHGSPLAEWQEEMLQEIDIATDRLTSLTDDLLDVTRLQAGQLLLHPAPTDLMALIRRVVGRMPPAATGHDIVIEPLPRGKRRQKKADDPSAVEVIVTIDSRRIEQVLTNLLMNAIKYSPAGGSVHISLAVRKEDGLHTPAQTPHDVRSTARNHSSYKVVEIEVRDHGIGIPLSQQGLIFGRFMRADNARQAGISGTGLGLYISRGLVEQHGGQIWFESQEGKGTTFHVTLPLQLSQDTSTMA
ncbi:MAG TPA: PAS domain S-box protein [Ktedonobacterales bacterium]